MTITAAAPSAARDDRRVPADFKTCRKRSVDASASIAFQDSRPEIVGASVCLAGYWKHSAPAWPACSILISAVGISMEILLGMPIDADGYVLPTPEDED
ncbi:MAG: hypothetical protein U0936_18350 [Planctomycetaceae bacterium]